MRRGDRHIAFMAVAVAVLALTVLWLTGGADPQLSGTTAAAADSAQSAASPASSADASYRPTHSAQPATPYDEATARVAESFPFDPNTADSTQLLRLGLQPWQVRNIYTYRRRGGVYRTKQDFARLYGLTVKEYRRLEPYIRIGADYQPASMLLRRQGATADTLPVSHKLKEHERVVLNHADTAALQRVPGIGPYFASEIVRHGRWLGGYVSVSQLDEIDGFPASAKQYFVIDNPQPLRLNVNRLTLQQLRRHPYVNYFMAKAITDYRRLHGDIHSLEDLRFCRDFTDDVIRKLSPYVEY